MWRLWAKALGQKEGRDVKEADKIAIIRTFIMLQLVIKTCGVSRQTATMIHQIWRNPLYNDQVIQTVLLMSLAYAQKQRFRVTLELDVFEDFDPNQIDWEKVLDVQGNESVSAYIEDLSTPDRW